MKDEIIYDIFGIGIGPFNLGLAALCHPIEPLKTIFIEQKPEFGWHEGMMIPGTTLQVSYLADLVTLADPSSRFTYLSFLRNQNRLIQFGIHENNYITRSEYNRYCKWVCSKLRNLLFGTKVENITYEADDNYFVLQCRNVVNDSTFYFKTRHIVAGTGTVPSIPKFCQELKTDRVIHSSAYMKYKDRIVNADKISIIGSGQSAAEIFYDLLNENKSHDKHISWYTRADRFYAMEHSKLSYEMTSPDYIDFFYSLSDSQKKLLLSKQDMLYKGINHQLLSAIYDKLYEFKTEGEPNNICIRTNSILYEITDSHDKISLGFKHNILDQKFITNTDFVILATGYHYKVPDFLKSLKTMIRFSANDSFHINRNYSIDNENRIFVQNAELQSHGFNAPDLGLGPYRNAVIINTILGSEYYPVDSNITFQSFGVAS